MQAIAIKYTREFLAGDTVGVKRVTTRRRQQGGNTTRIMQATAENASGHAVLPGALAEGIGEVSLGREGVSLPPTHPETWSAPISPATRFRCACLPRS